MISLQNRLPTVRTRAPRKLKEWPCCTANPTGLQIARQKLTYLTIEALCKIHAAVKRVQSQSVEGLIEEGCTPGGSTIQIGKSNIFEEKSRKLYIHKKPSALL